MPFSAFAGWGTEWHQDYLNLLKTDRFVKALERKPKQEDSDLTVFDPLLQKHGYLDIKLADTQKYIDNDIHPLFQEERWDDTFQDTPTALSHLQLARRLASLWLTRDELLNWFVDVYVADAIVEDKNADKLVLHCSRSLSRAEYEQAREEAKAEMNSLANQVMFFWQPNGTNAKKSGAGSSMHFSQLHALATVLEDEIPDDQLHNYDTFAPRIGVNTHRLYHLLSDDGAYKNSASQNLRFQARVAIDLLHEFAHVWYCNKMVKGFKGMQKKEDEPYVHASDFMPEMGYSWLNSLFGSLVANFNEICDFHFGSIGHMVATPWNFAISNMYVSRVVPMEHVEALFLKETWDRPVSLPLNFATNRECYIARRIVKEQWRLELYIGRNLEAVCIQSPGRVAKQISQPSVPSTIPSDVSVPEWFEQIFIQDLQKAKAKRLPACNFNGPRGDYKNQCYDGEGPEVKAGTHWWKYKLAPKINPKKRKRSTPSIGEGRPSTKERRSG